MCPGACPPEPMQTPGQRERTAAHKRQLVLGRAVPAAQLEELSRLLPLAEVQVEHFRHVENISPRPRLLSGQERAELTQHLGKRLELWPMGGHTHVTITSGQESFEGIAYCRLDENFNRRRGIAMAFGRALKELRVDRKKAPGVKAMEHLAESLSKMRAA